MSKKPNGKGRRGKPRRNPADTEPKKAIRAIPRLSGAAGVLLLAAASLVTDHGYWRGLFAAVVLIFAICVAGALATVIVSVAG